MKALIITYGSRGDVQPYLALALGLKESGHEVVLATSERFRAFVEEHGLRYGHMSDDLLAIIDTDKGKDLLEKGSSIVQVVKSSIEMSRQIAPMQRALMAESWEVARDFGPDIIVYHSKAVAAPHIAEKLGIPCVHATPIPMFLPTRAFRFTVLPDWKLGGWYNRASYWPILFLTNRVLGRYTRDFRKRLDLPPVRSFDIRRMSDGSDIPILHGHSEAVLPRPADWPDSAHVTGYWFLDAEKDWTPPSQLTAFLEAGPPPVYVGFGSMAGRDPQRLAHIVVDALQEAGLRGVMASGWGGLKTGELPDTILQIDEAPHAWLLPRMAAVVHHGGAGTTAAGLRAGKPTVIVPFFADQPFWGGLVHEIGAGPKPLGQKKLTAAKLAGALREATGSQEIAETAARIGEEIRAEHGVANAVALIERYAEER
ncbi:nucleotide disphospho-sugar-binding domain-containing protein [Oricola indica]|uniref:glycosyltransferase n=1 Tax=Oricola indica TaxID=2872591 RepID=UPI003CCB8F17